MKIFLYSIGALGLLAVTISLCFVLFPKNAPAPGTATTTFPSATNTGTALPPEPATTAGVSDAFGKQIQNSNQINLTGAIVVMPYALQNWADANKGGQALLIYQSGTWKLLSMGGGAWDEASLEAAGVPAGIAAQLIAGAQ